MLMATRECSMARVRRTPRTYLDKWVQTISVVVHGQHRPTDRVSGPVYIRGQLARFNFECNTRQGEVRTSACELGAERRCRSAFETFETGRAVLLSSRFTRTNGSGELDRCYLGS